MEPTHYVPHPHYGWLPAHIPKTSNSSDSVSIEEETVDTTKYVECTILLPDDWDSTTFTCPSHNKFSVANRDMTEIMKSDIPHLPLYSSRSHVADMANLSVLDEATVLYNLKSRHASHQIYTKAGDILVSVNPFQWMDHMYTEQKLKRYMSEILDVDIEGDYEDDDDKEEINELDGTIKTFTSNRTNKEMNVNLTKYASNATQKSLADDTIFLDPHVFEISCRSYKGLVVEGRDQSILISGESGAGKTEAVKVVMSNLSSIGRLLASRREKGDDDNEVVVGRVLSSNYIFEAFGNAMTIHNDNSSRFSKFTTLQFQFEDIRQNMSAFNTNESSWQDPLEMKDCRLAGSITKTYVLEKSRVVQHSAKGERNFHIFYQLLATDDEFKRFIWKDLEGTNVDSFNYIGYTDTNIISGMSDTDRAEQTLRSLKAVGIVDDKLTTLLKAITIVLQLGNVGIGEDTDDSDKSIITTNIELNKLSELMGISTDEIEQVLTHRTVKARSEVFTVPLNTADAIYSRDALAKGIYSNIFDYLVETVNDATHLSSNTYVGTVSILDIFGFECFDVNRFEQLCINYANEKLQLKYNIDNFRAIQEEYTAEGIDHLVDFSGTNDSQVVEMIESKIGLVCILNEECVRPSSTADTFVRKLKRINAHMDCLIQNKLAPPGEFGIKHYAADVTYDASNFIVRNKDALADDLVNMACNCSNSLISVMASKMISGGNASKSTTGHQRGWMVADTVMKKFQTQLKGLFADIEATKTRYIRCIKPNGQSIPLMSDHQLILNQMRSAGLVTALRSAQMSFPIRMSHTKFLQRFDVVMKVERISETLDIKDVVKKMLTKSNFDVSKSNHTLYAVGSTRIYLRTECMTYLESKRLSLLSNTVVKIQSFIRMTTLTRQYHEIKQSSILIQTHVRMYQKENLFGRKKKAVVALQCSWRCHFAQLYADKIKKNKAARKIQARWRYKCSWSSLLMRLAAIRTIQRFLRSRLNKEHFVSRLAKVVEAARLNKQIESFILNAKKDNKNERLEGLVIEATEIFTVVQKELYRLRAENSSLQGQVLELQGSYSKLQTASANSNAHYILGHSRASSLEEKNNELKNALQEVKAKNRELRYHLNDTLDSWNRAAIEFAEEKKTRSIMYEKEQNTLREKLDTLKISHETELYLLKRRHAVKERELKEKLQKISQTKEDEEIQYQQNLLSMMNIINEEDEDDKKEEKNENKTDLQMLRDQVAQMKLDYERKLTQSEEEFKQWRKNYFCPECADRKKKKKKRFMGLF